MTTGKFVAYIITVTLLLVSNSSVLADVAPPEPPSGADPVPGNEITNVRMVAETVLIDISAHSPLDIGNGKVTATFTMRNMGDVDERMDVRFPLDQTTGWGTLCSDPAPQFSPIADLQVKVSGQSVPTQKTYESITLPTIDEPHPTITIPCWESFPVSFSVGQDVAIEVTYTTEPYHSADASYSYAYILETGIGWKDTIGAADIIFQLPYELNGSNFYSCRPADCVIDGNKIQWHYEDFDPTSNIVISLLPPPLWQRIGVETENTASNPNDGEAWGRLAKAYKESIMQRRGFRSEPAAIERYRLSKEAYETAIRLLPDDADWHYGFAELLCWNAEWNNFLVHSNTEAWVACVEQVQQVLTLNPNHEKTMELIDSYGGFEGMIDFGGSQPDYVILTPKPTLGSTPAVAFLDDSVTAIATRIMPTLQFTKTSIEAATTATITTPMLVETSNGSNVVMYIGGVVLTFVAVFMVLRFRKA